LVRFGGGLVRSAGGWSALKTLGRISQVELGQKLKISQHAVSRAVRRGKQLASRNSYSLKD